MKRRNDNRLKCFDLFDKGYDAADVCRNEETKGIASRATVYKWFDEWKENDKDRVEESIKNVRQAILKEDKEDVDPELVAKIKIGRKIQSNWFIDSVIKNAKTCQQNHIIKNKLTDLLLEELEQVDKNYRAINALSSSIAFHWKIERESGFYHLLDTNAAIKVLEAAGYHIDSNPDMPQGILEDNKDVELLD